MHRRHDLVQRQPDRERDQHAGRQDDAEEDHGDRQHPARYVGQRPVEGLLRLLFALAHLDRQFVDGADRVRLAGVDGVAQQLGAVGEFLGQFRKTLAHRQRPRVQPRQRHALQIVVGEVDHHGDGFFDRLGVAAGVVGRGRRKRKIIGVGGDQHRGERLAGFAERGPDQRVAMPGGALYDRIKPGHVLGRAEHLVFIGLGDFRLHRAQFAKAVEEAAGDVFEPLDRSRQHRVVRGARGQGAEHRFAQQQDLGEQLRTRLVDVAVDQVLQAAGFAFQRCQDLVGFPDLADIVPGRAQHLGAVPDQDREHDHDGRVEGGDRQDAPADRYGTQQLDDAKAAPRGKTRRPFHCLVLLRYCGQFTPPCEFVRSAARPRGRAAPWRRARPSPPRTVCGRSP